MKAENSTSRNLCVAIARPSQGGGGGACTPPMLKSPEETAVAGLPAGYDVCGNGFTLKGKKKIIRIVLGLFQVVYQLTPVTFQVEVPVARTAKIFRKKKSINTCIKDTIHFFNI